MSARLPKPAKKPKILSYCLRLLVHVRNTEPRRIAALGISSQRRLYCSFALFELALRTNKGRQTSTNFWRRMAPHRLLQSPSSATAATCSNSTFECRSENINERTWPGIFPDCMHIIDLAVTPDMAIALLLDWTDTSRLIDLPSRPARLEWLSRAYREWVGNASDRASSKLFTTEILKPGGSTFATVSQHYVSAAAARGLLIFLAKMAQQFAEEHGTEEDL